MISSFVSYMSRAGAHTCSPFDVAVGIPKKLSKRRLTSESHLATDLNGRQRSIAIIRPSLCLHLHVSRGANLSTVFIYQMSIDLSNHLPSNPEKQLETADSSGDRVTRCG